MPAATSYALPGTTGGNREDLRDVLTILEPEATPVVSSMRKGPAPRATTVEWLVDSLRAARVGGVPEGQDASSFNNKAVARARIGNYLQIIRDEYGVTDVQQMVDTAAVADEFAYAKAKCVREMKRDLEANVCSGQDRLSGTGTADWETRCLFDWIDSAGPSDVPAAFRTPAGSISTAGAAITEAQFNDVLQSMFEVHGQSKSYLGVLGTELCQQVDNYTRLTGATDSSRVRYQVRQDASSHTITLSVKRFESTFGTVNFVPTTFMNPTPGTFVQTAGLILDQSLLELMFLENLHSVDLADEGGGPRGYAKAMFTLCVKNPRGLGKITA